MINFDDFKKLEIKIAQIKEVKPHPNADKLYIITIDLGSEKKDIIAGIKEHYNADELVGKKIVVLNNLQPVKIRGIESSSMLLAAKDSENKLSIITVDRDIAVGSTVS